MNRNKHTKQTGYSMIRSSIKIAVVLFCSLLFFQSNTIKAQVLNNNGVVISVTSGAVVQGDTLENTVAGRITNNGTIGLRGHYINLGITSGNGIYNIAGNWTNTGVFNPGTSTVHFNGSNIQTITKIGGEIFNNLTINNSGVSAANRIILSDNVNVSGTLTINLGNIETGINTLYLTNQTPASLDYTSISGSRVIGKFERGINPTGNYLFPLGSDSNYNPLNLTINTAPTAGSVLSEFINLDPGSSGLPLPDVDVEVYEAYNDGYWSLTSNGFSCADYNINLAGSGFLTPIQDITRIIKRPAGGDWLLDGTHSDAIDSVGYRNNLSGDVSPSANHFGFGRSRPRILEHPADTAVCDGESASFSVLALGRFPLSYQWQENRGSGWHDIPDAGIYSGTMTDFLLLSTTTLFMDGFQYRVVVTDFHGNFNISEVALLTVKPLPVAVATPDRDTLCNNETIFVVITSDVPGTTFELEVLYSGNIQGASTTLDGETINQTLTNPGDIVDSVIYRIIPTGPGPTSCVGICDTVRVLINPTPRVIPVVYADRICNLGTAEVELTTPTVMTHGIIQFDYTVTLTSDAVGNSDPLSDLDPGHLISFDYENVSVPPAPPPYTVQSVYYHITPKSVGTGCASGLIETAEVKIHPEPVHDIIVTNPLTCGGGSDLALRAIVSSGTEPLSIDWYGPFGIEYHDTVEIGNLYGGTYYITVTDNLGCVASEQEVHTKAIPTPVFDPILKAPYYMAHTTCHDSNDGEILVGIQTTENLPFTYWLVWENSDTVRIDTLRYEFDQFNPATYDTIYNLVPGNYVLWLRDVNGCPYDFDTKIEAPDPISVIYDTTNYSGFNISCKGYNDGAVKANAYGGVGDYTYSWFTYNGVITGDPSLDTLSNLIAGTYYVRINDGFGCEHVDSITLIEPDGITLVSADISESPDGNFNISCHGIADGTIELVFAGGSGTYFYNWTGPEGSDIIQGQEDQTGLIAGSYSVIITDANGCDMLFNYDLTEPDTLDIAFSPDLTFDGLHNINCNGGTADIDITVSGGSGTGYQYTWYSANGTGLSISDEDQTGLSSGVYRVTVEDLNGCIYIDSIEITEPDPLELIIVAYGITCEVPGMDNGSIDLEVSGGGEPYVYNWSNGSTSQDINNLVEGRYIVVVTDTYGCVISDSGDIFLPPPLEFTKDVSDYNGVGVSCNGFNNGWISVNMVSGEEPYSYIWTGPGGYNSGESFINNLLAGRYIIEITDQNLCKVTDTTDLSEPGRIGIDLLLSQSNFGGYNVNCFGDNTATIDVIPVNPVGEVRYFWTDGSLQSSRSELNAGEYGLIIVDDNNCSVDSVITLTEPDQLTYTSLVDQPYCVDMPDGQITLTGMGGYVLADYNFIWEDNSTGNILQDLAAGNYIFVMTDDNGCSISDTIVVTSERDNCLTIPNAISPNGDNINDKWNIDLINLYPNAEIKIFNRWGKLIWASEKGYPQSWDGTSKGKLLPIDSYHYIINLNNGTKRIIGFITIVR